MNASARFLIYADGAVFGPPVASLEQAQERAFHLLQKHARVHVESIAPASRRYWRYDARAYVWREAPLGAARDTNNGGSRDTNNAGSCEINDHAVRPLWHRGRT